MKCIFRASIAAFLIWSLPVVGQDTVRMSLDEALSYALQNNSSQQLAQLDIDKARQDVKATTASGLPQIAGNVQYTNYPALPVSLIPAEFFGGNPGEFIEARFGTSNNMTASVSLNQMIFDGRFFQGLKAAQLYVDLVEVQGMRTAAETKHQVTKAYYGVQLAMETSRILQSNQEAFQQLLNETGALFKEGFIESIEVDRARLALSNIQTQLQSVERQIVLAYALLKFQMGMDIATPLVITDTFSASQLADNALMEASFAAVHRSDYRALLLQEELLGLNIKSIRSGYYPSLYLFGTTQAQAQRQSFNFLDTDQPWFYVGFFGFTLNVPIWDSFEKSARIQKQQIEVKQLQLAQSNLQQAINLEVLQAQNAYQEALNQLSVQEENLKLAQRIFDVSTTKYNEGVGSSLEVNSAQTTLYQTQSAYLNTLYQVMSAKADLGKAIER
jgi:outer membrane protein TolC